MKRLAPLFTLSFAFFTAYTQSQQNADAQPVPSSSMLPTATCFVLPLDKNSGPIAAQLFYSNWQIVYNKNLAVDNNKTIIGLQFNATSQNNNAIPKREWH